MNWHNAKKQPPNADGWYFYSMVLKGGHVICGDTYYSTRLNGWNIGLGTEPDSRKYEMFPDYWAEHPTVEELKGV